MIEMEKREMDGWAEAKIIFTTLWKKGAPFSRQLCKTFSKLFVANPIKDYYVCGCITVTLFLDLNNWKKSHF
jgi:hypothetical protein